MFSLVSITLHEIERPEPGHDAYIVISWNGQEIWREIRYFEYYPRYLQLGNILKEKYGDRLIDFEAEYNGPSFSDRK